MVMVMVVVVVVMVMVVVDLPRWTNLARNLKATELRTVGSSYPSFQDHGSGK